MIPERVQAMRTYDSELERVVLESVIPQLEADGYRVIVQPQAKILPEFMRGYRPDAVALRADKKIAIEVKSRAPLKADKLSSFEALFAAHPDWEFRILYAPPLRSDTEAYTTVPSASTLEQMLDSISKAEKQFGPVPVLLTAWSVFEAAARALKPSEFERPQPSARLVEIMASEGYLTPKEADQARALGQIRNRAAHGDLSVPITDDELEEFVGVVRGLVTQTRHKPGKRVARTRA